MKTQNKSISRFRRLQLTICAILVLAAGCTTTSGGPASAFNNFIIDFAREAFAAWLL